MKTICFVTAARSEYGPLKWLMYEVKHSKDFVFQLIVTGGHLSLEQGHTIDQIVADGFIPNEIVDVQLNTKSKEDIAFTMGKLAEGFSRAFGNLKPDYIVVLGDRYELLPITNTAFVMGIPIIHISGGDVTEGAIDNGIRNAVTMLSSYHFPGTTDSANNIIRMIGSNNNVWAVGEPGLDAFKREQLMTKEELEKNIGLTCDKKWGLMTYHPETRESLKYNLLTVENCINALLKLDNFQTVVTYANTDYGGNEINQYLNITAEKYPDNFIVVPSLGHLRYLSFMKQASLVIGNSSSGIIEAPTLKIPVVNIGNRQKGRYQCRNIIQSSNDEDTIYLSILEALNQNSDISDCDYWGDGHASEKIYQIILKKLQ